MTQPITAAPSYDPTAVATIHALADTLAVRHLPTPQYINLYRHRMPTAMFEAAASEHNAEIIERENIRLFKVGIDLGDMEITLTCFEAPR